jgi:hypothetical protein
VRISSARSARRRAARAAAESTWTPRAAAGTTRPAAGATATRLKFWRHGFLLINLSDSDHKGTILALARNNDLLVFAAFESGIETVQAQPGFWSFARVAAEAGSLEHRTDVLSVGESFLLGRRRQLTEVDITGKNGPASDKQT